MIFNFKLCLEWYICRMRLTPNVRCWRLVPIWDAISIKRSSIHQMLFQALIVGMICCLNNNSNSFGYSKKQSFKCFWKCYPFKQCNFLCQCKLLSLQSLLSIPSWACGRQIAPSLLCCFIPFYAVLFWVLFSLFGCIQLLQKAGTCQPVLSGCVAHGLNVC